MQEKDEIYLNLTLIEEITTFRTCGALCCLPGLIMFLWWSSELIHSMKWFYICILLDFNFENNIFISIFIQMQIIYIVLRENMYSEIFLNPIRIITKACCVCSLYYRTKIYIIDFIFVFVETSWNDWQKSRAANRWKLILINVSWVYFNLSILARPNKKIIMSEVTKEVLKKEIAGNSNILAYCRVDCDRIALSVNYVVEIRVCVFFFTISCRHCASLQMSKRYRKNL